MTKMQLQVAEFNRRVGAERGDTPAIRAPELRARLILEEAFETAEAMLGPTAAAAVVRDMYGSWRGRAARVSKPDLVETVDGLCDLLFVTFGATDALGIDIEPFFDVVHKTNMEKLNGPVDANGKKLKPPGWTPPTAEIVRLLQVRGWRK